MLKNGLLLLLCVILVLQCKSSQQNIQKTQIDFSQGQKVLFLDSTRASQAIIQDQKMHFFDQIGKLDMSIQLKRAYPDSISRTAVLDIYLTSLQESTRNFTSDEIAYVHEAMQEVYKHCNSIASDIFPKEVKLIKAMGYHYGYSAYYTRENCIIIPRGELLQRNKKDFIHVMLHEIFHIYSRYHPEKRDLLYQLIGFKSIGDIRNLKLSAEMRRRMLLNPDGVNYAYAISLQQQDSTYLRAIPALVSSFPEFIPGKLDYFDYLEFGLFPIEAPFSRLIPVKSDVEGRSPLRLAELPDFRTQIHDNTDYIIHPDEIMADNFVLLALGETAWSDLSVAGKMLLQKMKKVLK